MKRILSGALCLIMLLGAVLVTASCSSAKSYKYKDLDIVYESDLGEETNKYMAEVARDTMKDSVTGSRLEISENRVTIINGDKKEGGRVIRNGSRLDIDASSENELAKTVEQLKSSYASIMTEATAVMYFLEEENSAAMVTEMDMVMQGSVRIKAIIKVIYERETA